MLRRVDSSTVTEVSEGRSASTLVLTLNMQESRSSERSEILYQSKRRNIAETWIFINTTARISQCVF
jgi:hypothetical protein